MTRCSNTGLPAISGRFRPIFSPFPAAWNWLECRHSGLKAKPKDLCTMNTDAAALRGNWNYPTSVKFGCGRIKELADHCKALGMKRKLLITDPGLANLPMIKDAIAH